MEYNVVLHLSTTIPLFVLTSFIFVALVSIYFRTWCFIKNKKNDLGRQRSVQVRPWLPGLQALTGNAHSQCSSVLLFTSVALQGSTSRNQELQTFITDQRKSFRRIIAFMIYFIILSVLSKYAATARGATVCRCREAAWMRVVSDGGVPSCSTGYYNGCSDIQLRALGRIRNR